MMKRKTDRVELGPVLPRRLEKKIFKLAMRLGFDDVCELANEVFDRMREDRKFRKRIHCVVDCIDSRLSACKDYNGLWPADLAECWAIAFIWRIERSEMVRQVFGGLLFTNFFTISGGGLSG
jgi:hypothetical protein